MLVSKEKSGRKGMKDMYIGLGMHPAQCGQQQQHNTHTPLTILFFFFFMMTHKKEKEKWVRYNNNNMFSRVFQILGRADQLYRHRRQQRRWIEESRIVLLAPGRCLRMGAGISSS